MLRFGEKWMNHEARLADAWRRLIHADDVVLLPGDISWAQSISHVLPDLQWLTMLPGKKVLVRGNHDHWWDSGAKARHAAEPLGFHLLEGDALIIGGVVLCGAMGHLAPNDPYYRKDEKKDRYTRELLRLESAFKAAEALRQPNQPLIAMSHYPPLTSDGQRTGYTELISHYKPTYFLYGHLHHDKEWEIAVQGEFEGVHYALVAADYLAMTPRLIMEV